MIVMVCIDDCNGMMFNHRRQSRDRIVQERMLLEAAGSRLWMNEYSYRMFAEMDCHGLEADEEFLGKAGSGEYCFVENQDILPYEAEIETIILFKWNRSYPADFYFPADILSQGWILADIEEFEGSSHEKITREVYKHEKN